MANNCVRCKQIRWTLLILAMNGLLIAMFLKVQIPV